MLVLDFDIYFVDEGMLFLIDVDFNCKVGEVLKECLCIIMMIIVSY